MPGFPLPHFGGGGRLNPCPLSHKGRWGKLGINPLPDFPLPHFGGGSRDGGYGQLEASQGGADCSPETSVTSSKKRSSGSSTFTSRTTYMGARAW